MGAAERVKLLRQELKDRNCDGFIVPHADQHQTEYPAANAERLAWLTGFTGSAGNAVVLQDQAAIFVDGRYTSQAAQQVDQNLIAVKPSAEITPSQWLEQTVQPGQRIGFDPWLHTTDELENYTAACESNGAKLVACEPNPLDKVWQDQPAEPQGPIVPHDIKYAGKSLTEKIGEIATALEHKQIDAVILTALDSVAWLLNLRSSDVPHSPLALVFAVLNSDRTVILFASSAKVNDQLRHHFGPQVAIKPKTEFVNHLQGLANKKVQIDPSGTPAKVVQVGFRLAKELLNRQLLRKDTTPTIYDSTNDSTVICRCEKVTLKSLKAAVNMGITTEVSLKYQRVYRIEVNPRERCIDRCSQRGADTAKRPQEYSDFVISFSYFIII